MDAGKSRLTRQVTEMQRYLGAHVNDGAPSADIPTSLRETRIELLREEFEDEYVPAARSGDLVQIADALADMAYVIFGTAVTYGIPLDRVLDEVHRSNMTKSPNPSGGKFLKGPSYSPPDIPGVLAAPDTAEARDSALGRVQALAAQAPFDTLQVEVEPGVLEDVQVIRLSDIHAALRTAPSGAGEQAGPTNDPALSIFPGTNVDRSEWGDCGCSSCVAEAMATKPSPDKFFAPFIVCPNCGKKRCPKATHHDHECTGSNEPGQLGSRFAVAGHMSGEEPR